MKKRTAIIFVILFIIIIVLIVFAVYIAEENTFRFGKSSKDKGETAPYLGNISIYYIDVGQGDSTLIILPNNKTLLIDAGTLDGGKKVLSELALLNISRIDAMVATHPDSDHIGGLEQTVKSLDVKEFLDNCQSCDTKTCERLSDTLQKTAVLQGCIGQGDRLALQEGIEIAVLNPPKTLFEKDNDNSIVLKINYRKASFIFMGDCEKECEQGMIESRQTLDADILRVGHHGSHSSTSQEFLSKVRPDYAIISVGENSFGHPHEETLQVLSSEGITVLRTDLSGTIHIDTDGLTYGLSTG
jgi:competence protein ComEC